MGTLIYIPRIFGVSLEVYFILLILGVPFYLLLGVCLRSA
jgi:hypothetical protein